MGRSPLPLFAGLAIILLLIAGSSGSKPEAKTIVTAPHPAAPQRTDVVVLLDFGGDWCSHCREMEPTVAQLEREGVTVQKSDPNENEALAKKWNVHDCPCFIAIRNGKEIARHVGTCSINELRNLVDQCHPAKAQVSKPEPIKPARGPEGWRMRLFYPPGSTLGESLKVKLSAMKAIAAKYGFDAGSTDSALFKPWRGQLSAKEVTLVLVHPDERIVYQESKHIPTDPIELRETLRNAARQSWKGAYQQ